VTSGSLTLGSGGSLSSPAVIVAGGTLVTTANQQVLDTAAVSVANGASFTLGGNETIGSLADKSGQTADGSASVALVGHTLTVASPTAATNTSFGGVISGTAAAGLTKSGAGTLTLTGANSYGGLTHVTGGTLATGSAGRLAASGSLVVDSGAMLTLGGAQSTTTLGLSGT
jgi:autotransporter-associated beta strand protein